MLFLILMATFAQAGSTLDLLRDELRHSQEALAALPEAPHYTSLAVVDDQTVRIVAQDGAVSPASHQHSKILDTDLRVGTPTLDSTHELRGFSGYESNRRTRVLLPLDNDQHAAARHIIWREIDAAYKSASERIVMLRANRIVKVAEEDPAPDFEPRTPVNRVEEVEEMSLDIAKWEKELQALAARVDAYDHVWYSRLQLTSERQVNSFVDTEGTALQHGRHHTRLTLSLQTMASDGDEIDVFRAFDVHNSNSLPDSDVLQRWAEEAVKHLLALRNAPRGEPYTGPVILNGKAAGVFFHEVFGHRVEGHRQKSDYEGKTFANHVGKEILPDFINVYDDPTLSRFNDTDLNGFYSFDDEGVAAQRANLVEDGKFVGFLMGRSPIQGFENSNGHGRRSPGYAPVSRMGNTIIESEKTVDRTTLRKLLIREAKKQGLSYGYLVEDIDGGFTMTGRVTPNAFNVRANTTRRIFVDGRPDQLVRGIDLVGTPMVAFKSIVAAGEQIDVFNGHCGAESGYVPVSAVAPDILVSRVEFQRKEKSSDRPPLLEKPRPMDGQSSAQEVTP